MDLSNKEVIPMLNSASDSHSDDFFEVPIVAIPSFRKRHHSTPPNPTNGSSSHLRHRRHSFRGRGRISESSGINGSTSALVEGDESDSDTDSHVEMVDTETLTDSPPQQFDWEAENRKAREVFDDGNQSFFWYVFLLSLYHWLSWIFLFQITWTVLLLGFFQECAHCHLFSSIPYRAHLCRSLWEFWKLFLGIQHETVII